MIIHTMTTVNCDEVLQDMLNAGLIRFKHKDTVIQLEITHKGQAVSFYLNEFRKRDFK